MCGRFTLATTADQIHSTYGLSHVETEQRFNIAPTQPVTVVLKEAGDLQIKDFLWGLIPNWATDRRIASKCFNARAETVLTKPAFASAVQRHRCLIPMSGFYEWTEKGTRVWLFSAEELLSAAGVWEEWEGPDGLVRTCSMLTRTADEQMAAYHHRMPLLLAPEHLNGWLDPQPITREKLDSLVGQDTPELKIHEVSLRVNTVTEDDSALVDPILPLQGTLGF